MISNLLVNVFFEELQTCYFSIFKISFGASTIIVATVYYFALRNRDEDNLDSQAEPILRNASLEDDSEQELKFEEETDSQ
jgi:hypothetical protein